MQDSFVYDFMLNEIIFMFLGSSHIRTRVRWSVNYGRTRSFTPRTILTPEDGRSLKSKVKE